MSIESWYVQRKLKGAYKAMNNDGKASLLGVVLAAIIALNVNYTAVFHLDPAECGKLAGAVLTAVLGYYVNRPDKTVKP
jgi:hypothetical protein